MNNKKEDKLFILIKEEKIFLYSFDLIKKYFTHTTLKYKM